MAKWLFYIVLLELAKYFIHFYRSYSNCYG